MPEGWRSCWYPDWKEFYYFKCDEKKQACGPATWVRPTNPAPITTTGGGDRETVYITVLFSVHMCAYMRSDVYMCVYVHV